MTSIALMQRTGQRVHVNGASIGVIDDMAVAMLHAYRSVSCTDQMCMWSAPKSSAPNVRTVADMYPDSTSAVLNRPVSDADRMSLLNSLLQCDTQCGMTWLLSPEPPAAALTVPSVREVILSVSSEDQTVSAFQLMDIISELVLSKEHIMAVETSTRQQHENPLWGHYRAGRLTASNFGAVIHCMQGSQKPTASLMKTLLGEYDASGAKPVQWGIVHEATALEKYAAERKTSVAPSGIWLHGQGMCGASPDGIVDDNTIVEVKCPFSLRKGDAVDSSFLHTDSNNKLALNLHHPQGHAYYHQIQGNLWLTGRRQCDLIVWTPKSTVVVRVNYDQQYELKYLSLLHQFYHDHFLGAYITAVKRKLCAQQTGAHA